MKKLSIHPKKKSDFEIFHRSSELKLTKIDIIIQISAPMDDKFFLLS